MAPDRHETGSKFRGMVFRCGLWKCLTSVGVLVTVVLLGGCAVGNKYEYRMLSMPIPVEGGGKLGLTVADRRAYILSGNKTPDFVGLQRGGFGNPFDVATASGRPMAQDMADTLKAALEAKGFSVMLMDGDGADLAALGRAASTQGLHRVVVLRIAEWKTDTAVSTRLFFDLQLLIVGKDGAVVAQNAINGSSAIGGGLPATIGAQAQQAFEGKIGQLFYPQEIRAALGGGKGP